MMHQMHLDAIIRGKYFSSVLVLIALRMFVFYIFGLAVYNLRPNQTINFLQDAATDVAELLEPSRRLFFSFFPAWLTSSRSEQGNMRGDLPTLSPRPAHTVGYSNTHFQQFDLDRFQEWNFINIHNGGGGCEPGHRI